MEKDTCCSLGKVVRSGAVGHGRRSPGAGACVSRPRLLAGLSVVSPGVTTRSRDVGEESPSCVLPISDSTSVKSLTDSSEMAATTMASAPAQLSLPTTYPSRPASKLQSKTRHSIDLADLTPNNIGQLRKLNSVLFPVKYSQGFYDDALLEERKRINKLGE